VVLPLADHRGFAVASARAWSGQTLAAGRYEVVAVDDGRDPRRSERVHRVLRGADRLIVRPGGSEIELYQAGADAARGDVLLFTESHAVPAPDAAEALLRHFERSQAVAATLRSGHIPRHGLAKLEEWVGERVATERLATRWWAGVSLRGFSLRRRLFQELGGFRTELERFAETALAIEMDRRGLRADLAREALVHHADCAWPGELERALLALGRGRRAFIEAGPPDLVEPYVGAPGERNRAVLDSRLARELCGALLRSLFSAFGGGGGVMRVRADASALLRWAPIAFAGARGACLGPRVGARAAFLRCMLPGGDPERRLERFSRAWSEVEGCGEIQHLARQVLPPPSLPLDLSRFAPGEMGDTDFVGFHGRETDAEGSFRWSSPAALWRLALSPRDYRAILSVSPPPADPHLRLYFNGHPVRAASNGASPRDVVFDLERRMFRAGGEQHLAILCSPFRPCSLGSTDGRTLGIAVRGLAVRARGVARGRARV